MNTLAPELLQPKKAIPTNFFLPKNSVILLFKNKNLQNAFTLKINGWRLFGQIRLDCRGETYWKFQEEYQEEETAPNLAE